MSHNCRNGRNDSGMGCVVMLVLAIIAMPIVGIYLSCTGEENGQKWLGNPKNRSRFVCIKCLKLGQDIWKSDIVTG